MDGHEDISMSEPDAGVSGTGAHQPYQPHISRDAMHVDSIVADANAPKEEAERAADSTDFSRWVVPDGKQPNDFHERLNSHPVYYTGLVIDKRRMGREAAKAYGRWSPRCELYLAPPPLEYLPKSWSASAEIDAKSYQFARNIYTIFLPINKLIQLGSFQLVNTELSDRAFMMSFGFFLKAITTGKVGTQGADLPSGHFFRDDTGKVHPKVEVFGEPIIRKTADNRGLNYIITQYLEKRQNIPLLEAFRTDDSKRTAAQRALLDREMPIVVSEVGFRKEVISKQSLLGVRFWFVTHDKRVELGRALQRRVWRNAVGCGDASANTICQRQLNMEDSWQKEVSSAAEEREKGKDQNAVDSDDNGPALSNAEGMNLFELEQHREEDKILNGADGEAEPDDGIDLDGGGGGGGGSEKDAARAAKEAAKAERKKKRAREKALAGLALNLGLKSCRVPGKDLTAVGQVYLQKVRGERMKRHPEYYIAAGSGNSGFGQRQRGDPERINGDEREVLIGFAEDKFLVKIGVTNVRTLVNIVYRQLLNLNQHNTPTPGTPYHDFIKDLKEADDEARDLGDFNHPYNPGKWFTFTRINELWGLSGDACAEQLDVENYLKPLSDELKKAFPSSGKDSNADNNFELRFPIPSLVWRLSPEKGGKLKEMAKRAPFWAFFPLQELMEQCTRQADLEDAQAAQELEGQKDGTADTVMDQDEETKEAINQFKQMQSTRTWKAAMSHAKKYDQDLTKQHKGGNATDRLLQAQGHQTAAQRAARAAHETTVQDRMADVVGNCRQLRTMVDTVSERQPSQEALLRRYFRDHQFENAFKPEMRPQAATTQKSAVNTHGHNDVHQQHVAYLSEGGASNPPLFMPYTGFDNLTRKGGLIAEKHFELKHIACVTNSVHVLWTMICNVNPSAYRETRRIGLHLMKVGPPGIGKSYIDDIFKKIKVPLTAIETLHSSNMAKFVETPTPDRNIVEDEASSKVIGDSAKTNNSNEHTALTLHKAWLSGDYLSFTVFDMRDGQRVQVRKRVQARGCHITNANIQHLVKDTSIYDRYIIYVVVPFMNITSAQMDVLRAELRPDIKRSMNEYLTRMQLLDRLQFGTCKMLDVEAATINITIAIMHMMLGIPLIRKYGISNDPSMRRIPQGLEFATTATITMGVLDTYSGSYVCTIREPKTATKSVVERPWREDFMKEVRYRLFCTEDVAFYVISQIFRQQIGDYSAWDDMRYMASAYCGYSDEYFKPLFDREAWVVKEKVRTDPITGEERIVRRRSQRFPFTDIELFVNENSNRDWLEAKCADGVTRKVPDIDQFVIDNERTKVQWAVKGYENRGTAHSSKVDPNIVAYPNFVCWRESVESGNATEHQNAIDEFTHNNNNSNTTGGKTREVDQPKDGREQHQQRRQGRAPDRQHIDPNRIVMPGGLSNNVIRAVSDLSCAAFKHIAVSEQAIKLLMEKRCVVVPVIEEITDLKEPLRFKKTTDGDGKEVIVTRISPIARWEEFSHDLVDPYTNRVLKAGRQLVIYPMALRCFDPRLALFEMLAATEHAYTKPMTAPIDLSVPGFEGYQYTHTSKVRNVLMPKSMGSAVSSAVMRTLYMERTRKVSADFPIEITPPSEDHPEGSVKITEAEAYDRALDENERMKEELFGGIYEDEDVKEAVENFQADREWADAGPATTSAAAAAKKRIGGVAKSSSNSVSSAVASSSGRTKSSRVHLPPSFRQEAAVAAIEASSGTNKTYYSRYHVFDEFEDWMVRENGKALFKTVYYEEGGQQLSRTKYLRDKTYYPHVNDEMMREQLAHGHNYVETRKRYRGKLVQYPEEAITEAIAKETKEERKHRKNPASYMNISEKRCDAFKKFIADSFVAYENHVKSVEEHRQKARQETEQDIIRRAEQAAKAAQDKLHDRDPRNMSRNRTYSQTLPPTSALQATPQGADNGGAGGVSEESENGTNDLPTVFAIEAEDSRPEEPPLRKQRTEPRPQPQQSSSSPMSVAKNSPLKPAAAGASKTMASGGVVRVGGKK